MAMDIDGSTCCMLSCPRASPSLRLIMRNFSPTVMPRFDPAVITIRLNLWSTFDTCPNKRFGLSVRFEDEDMDCCPNRVWLEELAVRVFIANSIFFLVVGPFKTVGSVLLPLCFLCLRCFFRLALWREGLLFTFCDSIISEISSPFTTRWFPVLSSGGGSWF